MPTHAEAVYLAGRLDESRALHETMIVDSVGPMCSRAAKNLAVVLARQGHREEARRTLARYEKRADPSNLLRRAVAAALGEWQRAVQLLGEMQPLGYRDCGFSAHVTARLEPLFGACHSPP